VTGVSGERPPPAANRPHPSTLSLKGTVKLNTHLVRFLAAGSLLGIAALAGCAGSSQSTVPPAQTLNLPQSHVVAPQVLMHPNACKAVVTVEVEDAGGIIHLPACDTFGGAIGYPSNNAAEESTTTLTSYQTDPGGGTGKPASGTVIAWVKNHGNGSGSVTFAGSPVKTGTLFASPLELPAGHTYTLYVYAFGAQQGSEQLGSPTCTANKCTLTFPSPLTGQTVPQGIDLFFELAEN
jgi:hypothetical protein